MYKPRAYRREFISYLKNGFIVLSGFNLLKELFKLSSDKSQCNGSSQACRHQIQQGWLSSLESVHHQNSYYQANKIGNETRVEIHTACLVFLATVNKENSNSTRDFTITVELDKTGFKQYNSLVSILIKLSGDKCQYYAIVTMKIQSLQYLYELNCAVIWGS